MTAFLEILIFFIQAIFGAFIFVLLLRFYMQFFRVSFYNPLGMIALSTTNWLVAPVRKVIPSFFRIDTTTLLLAFLVNVLEYVLIFFLLRRVLSLALLPLFVITFLKVQVYFFLFLLIAQAILSWVNPFSPVAEPIRELTAPLLNPIRRFMPRTGPLDFSLFVAVLLAQALLILLSNL